MNNNLKILYDAYFKYIFNNIVVASTEHVRSKSIKSSFSDVIYMYRNKRFIIEMNNSYTSEIVYNNHFYLFYHHIFDLKNKNSYNSNIETYLIDIERKCEEDGIEKGSANEKISIAKILRKKHFTDKDIMEITGITKSQIKTI